MPGPSACGAIGVQEGSKWSAAGGFLRVAVVWTCRCGLFWTVARLTRQTDSVECERYIGSQTVLDSCYGYAV